MIIITQPTLEPRLSSASNSGPAHSLSLCILNVTLPLYQVSIYQRTLSIHCPSLHSCLTEKRPTTEFCWRLHICGGPIHRLAVIDQPLRLIPDPASPRGLGVGGVLLHVQASYIIYGACQIPLRLYVSDFVGASLHPVTRSHTSLPTHSSTQVRQWLCSS